MYTRSGCFALIPQKLLSDICVIAKLPRQPWVEFVEVGKKDAPGKLKDQRSSLQEVLTTPSLKSTYTLPWRIGKRGKTPIA